MPVADFAQGVKDSSYWMSHLYSMSAKPRTAASGTTDIKTAQTSAAPKAASSDSGETFFGDLLDVVNPLQHLPVVGTVYRAMTGDKIGDVEKVAGDTLYGGPVGLVSSLADLAFEKITGKDFGDTVMSWLNIDVSNTALASTKPATQQTVAAAAKPPQQTAALKSAIAPLVPQQPATAIATSTPKQLTPSSTTASAQSVIDISPQTDALLASLQKNGVNGDMQLRALDAYRRTMDLNAAVPTVPQTVQ